MPLGNWVMLEPGIPERVHLVEHALETRDITDPRSGLPARRNVCTFDVDELNGKPVVAKLSVMAEKLYAKLEPYIKDRAYRGYDFIITKTGSGFQTSYSVQVFPRG